MVSASERELVPLRRNRDFILYWSSQVVSTIGSRVTSVAYPLLVLAITDSPAQAGFVAFAQTLPFLLAFLPAGALVDRLNRKRIMLVSDAVRAAAMLTIVAALAADHITVAHIAVVAFVEGTFFVCFELAEAAALPRLVPAQQLPAAIAQNQARQQGADLVGQPLGGVLFGAGHAVPFLFDVVSYVVSFVALLFVRPALQAVREGPPQRLRADILEGIRWLSGQTLLRTIALAVAGWNFSSNALVLVLIIRAEQGGASPALIGAMLAFFGGGALVGSILATRIQRRLGPRAVMITATWAWVAVTFILAGVEKPLAIGGVVAVGSIVGPVFNVVVGSIRYALVPDHLQGRVVSAIRVLAWGSIPLGSIAAGFLVEAIGASRTIVVLGVVMVAVALGVTLPRSLRDVPEPVPAQAS